jgi:hypothetical protein
MTRIDRIRSDLTMAQHRGLVRDWYCYSPGDRHGRRWVTSVKTADMGFVDRTFTTRQCEEVASILAAGRSLTYDYVNAI